MQKDKIEVKLEIEQDQQVWLQQMVEQFDLGDTSKALRVLLDYAMEDASAEDIFAMSNVRCLRCG